MITKTLTEAKVFLSWAFDNLEGLRETFKWTIETEDRFQVVGYEMTLEAMNIAMAATTKAATAFCEIVNNGVNNANQDTADLVLLDSMRAFLAVRSAQIACTHFAPSKEEPPKLPPTGNWN